MLKKIGGTLLLVLALTTNNSQDIKALNRETAITVTTVAAATVSISYLYALKVLASISYRFRTEKRWKKSAFLRRTPNERLISLLHEKKWPDAQAVQKAYEQSPQEIEAAFLNAAKRIRARQFQFKLLVFEDRIFRELTVLDSFRARLSWIRLLPGLNAEYTGKFERFAFLCDYWLEKLDSYEERLNMIHTVLINTEEYKKERKLAPIAQQMRRGRHTTKYTVDYY